MTAQALTHSERVMLSYLEKQHGRELIESLRRISRETRIPREQIKKALQGLANKNRVTLRTIHQEDGSVRLGVTIKEEE